MSRYPITGGHAMGRTHHKEGICQDRKDLPPSPRVRAQDWQFPRVVDGEIVAAAGGSQPRQQQHEPSAEHATISNKSIERKAFHRHESYIVHVLYQEGLVHEDEQWAISPTQS